MEPPLMCEVCRNEPAVGVACVPGIPYSAAYGRNCLSRGADPYGLVRANIICCGGEEHVIPEYLDTVVYFQGEYVPIKEALLREPITAEDLRMEL